MMWIFENTEFLWLTPERRAAARARGFLFALDELRDILTTWADVIASPPRHSVDRLTMDLRDGGTVEILPARITIDAPSVTPASIRATVLHARDHWGGKMSLVLDETADRQERLMFRAYAEVYGIELNDQNDCFRHAAFTQAELARLPELRREIRARHTDAPPERPDEAQRLAADYARRFPFRLPAAA